MSPEKMEKVDQNVGINKGEITVSQQKDQISQEGMEQTIEISNNQKPNKKDQGKETVDTQEKRQ